MLYIIQCRQLSCDLGLDHYFILPHAVIALGVELVHFSVEI